MKQQFVVIGIDDSPEPFFPPQVLEVIRSGRVFSGGTRHQAIVRHLLPEGAEWIPVTAPIDTAIRRYEQVFHSMEAKPTPVEPTSVDTTIRRSEQTFRSRDAEPRPVEPGSAEPGLAEPIPAERGPIVVFASGDPLFFGLANTLRRRMPEAKIRLFPAFNSLQTLAHHLVMRYDDLRTVSLTGRPWPELDRALIERAPKIGVLTDRQHTPATIARRLLDYGYTAYYVYVGEHLGHPDRERVRRLSLTEAAASTFDLPNCLILHAEHADGSSCPLPPRPFGIADQAFALLDGRTRMITKAPIRLLTLHAMELGRRRTLWDVGFCTGSVSIEARLQFPHLSVAAFEVRPEGEQLIRTNARRFGAPGITALIGDFLQMHFTTGDERAVEQDGDRAVVHGDRAVQFVAHVVGDAGLTREMVRLPRPDAVFIGGHGGRLAEMVERVSHVLLPGGCVVFNSVSAESQATFAQAATACGLILLPSMRVALNDYNPIEIMKAERPSTNARPTADLPPIAGTSSTASTPYDECPLQ